MSKGRFVCIGVGMCALLMNGGLARAQDCNDLFNLNQVLTFNVTMDPAEWEALRFTCSNGVCDPPPHSYYQATLQCGSIGPLFVGIRQ